MTVATAPARMTKQKPAITRDRWHHYTYAGQTYPGVTSILRVLDKSDALMAWASRKVRTRDLLRNWAIVYVGNFVGAVSVAVMVVLAGWWSLDDGAAGETAVAVATQKTALAFGTVFWRGVLANALVCLAVWIATGGAR